MCCRAHSAGVNQLQNTAVPKVAQQPLFHAEGINVTLTVIAKGVGRA